ncbi:hypothetical protein [Mesorhizobium sp. B2-6-2]|uniref:hypothetical protein n=1 Tax=Mesorhizobium sp. B2-6-2 TaxID=2589915 RepID=UPI001125E996|nr:hypothetical protein [Mesorhizobium sp. B2-6-2]TPJ77158.1 hypothetical protein FJ419_16680 [Mesorhizobium sp. B2-6-2]
MTSEALVGKDRIKIDGDCTVEIARQADGVWQLSFLDGSGKRLVAPEPEQVKAESIGSDFIVRVLTVAKGPDANTLTATGKTELANYARISVDKGGAWKTQYALLTNTETPTAPIGPNGGPIMDMGHDSFIELAVNPDKPWDLTFYEEKDEVDAPNPSIILVEALKGDGTVANLEVAAGPKPSMLVASGPTHKTTRVRLLWAHGDHFHRREFNLPD